MEGLSSGLRDLRATPPRALACGRGSDGVSAGLGKRSAKIGREALDHAGGAAAALRPLLGLAAKDLPADLPVDLDELGVDRSRGPRLGGSDPRLDVLGELLVAAGRLTWLRRQMSGEVGHPLPERNEAGGSPELCRPARAPVVEEATPI